jgi:hypothetical protein
MDLKLWRSFGRQQKDFKDAIDHEINRDGQMMLLY